MINKDPLKIWEEHNKATAFNTQIGLYETIEENNEFFNDKQWEGVECPDLDLPVFNIFKTPINTFISMIVSNDIGIEINTFNKAIANEKYNELFSATEQAVLEVIEFEKIKTKNIEVLKNAAIEGDMCLYFYFDADEDIGQTSKGCIKCEVIDSESIEFANPVCREIQKQPYIIILIREHIDKVKEIALENGVDESTVSSIQPDNNYLINDDSSNVSNLVTYLVKFWFEKNKDGKETVRCIKCTKNIVIKEEFDTELSFYPVAFGNWEKVKNCYHGHSLISGMLPNQIFINKAYAMAMETIKKLAFPKVAYNEDIIDEWTNEIGAVGIKGGKSGEIDISKIARVIEGANMSPQVAPLIQGVLSDSRACMGANDVLMGDVRPDNAGAIIAVQNQSAMPLKLQRLQFEQFVEDYVRIIIDMISVYYGKRNAIYIDDNQDDQNKEQVKEFDFSELKNIRHRINVNVGASTYWSQINEIISLDNLLKNQLITPIQYLKRLPSGTIPKLNDLIKVAEEQENAQAQQQGQSISMPPAGGQANLEELLKGVK